MTTLERMLERISDTQDKRPSSVIFNTLATTAIEIDNLKINTEIFKEQTYLLSATGINLDNRAADYAIERYQATAAIRIGAFTDRLGYPYELSIGDRFSSPNNLGGLIFVVTGRLSPGQFLLTAEMTGTIGNHYEGNILPLNPQNLLGTAIIFDTQVPGQDTETDEIFRDRIIDIINNPPFGGNIADYRNKTRDINGVGDLKVIPVWEGATTVKLIIVDSEYKPVSETFVNAVKEMIDPTEYTGQGLGTAPIWHFVTVTTPNVIDIDITANLTLSSATIPQVYDSVVENLEKDFDSLRRSWANVDNLSIFIARVSSAILSTPEVVNVTDITINGLPQDFHLDNNDIPFLGQVTLYDN